MVWRKTLGKWCQAPDIATTFCMEFAGRRLPSSRSTRKYTIAQQLLPPQSRYSFTSCSTLHISTLALHDYLSLPYLRYFQLCSAISTTYFGLSLPLTQHTDIITEDTMHMHGPSHMRDHHSLNSSFTATINHVHAWILQQQVPPGRASLPGLNMTISNETNMLYP